MLGNDIYDLDWWFYVIWNRFLALNRQIFHLRSWKMLRIIINRMSHMIYWHNLIISAVMNGVMSTWSPVYWPDIEIITLITLHIAREYGVPELTAPWSAWWQSIAKCLNRFASVTSQVKSEAFSEKNKKDDEHAYIVKRQTISIILLLSTLRPVSESLASSSLP